MLKFTWPPLLKPLIILLAMFIPSTHLLSADPGGAEFNPQFQQGMQAYQSKNYLLAWRYL
jgi:hypothetical protein